MTTEASAEPTRIVIIRHGESVANATKSVHGPRVCEGLSELGRDQCVRLAARLARTGELAGSVLVASQYRRARQTAEAIAPAIGNPPLEIDERWGELDWGAACDGLTWAEAVERHGLPNWTDEDAPTFPGGESVAALQRRVAAAVDDLLARHRGRVVTICAHGGVVDMAVRYVTGAHDRSRFDLFTANTALTTIARTSSGRWRLERYNDAAHLQP